MHNGRCDDHDGILISNRYTPNVKRPFFSSKTMWFTRNLRVYDLFSGDFLCSSLLGKPSLQVSCYVGKSPSYNSLVNGMFYPSLYQVPQFGIAKLVHLTPITVGFMVDINQTNHQFITGGHHLAYTVLVISHFLIRGITTDNDSKRSGCWPIRIQQAPPDGELVKNIYIYTYIYIWPPNHPFDFWIFHYKPSIFGIPHLWKPPYIYIYIHTVQQPLCLEGRLHRCEKT